MASRRPCASSIGRLFHCLHATSQALQPMHTEVSVKNPTRAGWSGSYPDSSCTSGSGPYSRFSAPDPVRPGLAELTAVIAFPVLRRSRAGFFHGAGVLVRCPAVDPDLARLHPGPAAVGLHQLQQLRSAGTPSRPDVRGADLVLL